MKDGIQIDGTIVHNGQTVDHRRGPRCSRDAAGSGIGDWTVELEDDGSLRVYATGRGAPKILAECDGGSNTIRLTTLKILSKNK